MAVGGNDDDRIRAREDSLRAQSDSNRAGTDSARAQDDSDRKDRRALKRLLAYLGMGVAGALGLWWVQGLAQEAHDNTSDLEDLVIAEEREEAREQEQNCQTRNRATFNGRERFVILNRNLAGLINNSNNPAETQAFIDQLFKGINLDPTVEDLDCNKDGELTEAD